MADRKITDLTALAAGSQATGDLLTIVDVSEVAAADKNKKITVESLFKGIPGNVGIGTTSPTTLLEVKDTSSSASICITSPNTGESTLNLGDVDDINIQRIISDHSNNSLQIHTNNSERMRIDSSGNVGIGTSSPAQGPLHVHSSTTDAYFHLTNSTTGSAGSDGFSLHQSGNSTILNNRESDAMRFFTANTERMRIDSSGKVGIGTTSPTADGLHIVNSSQPDLFMGTSTNAEGFKIVYSDSSSVVGNVTSTPLRFVVGNSERMRIDSSGKVGIGTSSPSSLLHLSGNQTALRIQRTSSLGFLYNTGTASTSPTRLQAESGPLELFTNASQPIKFLVSGSEKGRFDTSGQLQIGTTAGTGELNVASGGDAAIDIICDSDNNGTNNWPILNFRRNSATGTPAARIYQQEANNALIFDNNGSERARITSAGGFFVATTNGTPGLGDTDTGLTYEFPNGAFFVSRGDNNTCVFLNKNSGSGSGAYMDFNKSGSVVGSISHNGSGVVSYNNFQGSHLGRLVDRSTPDIKVGTLIEATGTPLDYKCVPFTYTDVDGETQKMRKPWTGTEAVGATVSFDWNGTTYSGVVTDENAENDYEKSLYTQVCATAASKAVLGVFMCWDDDTKRLYTNSYNDMMVTSVGNFVVRMASGQTPAIGDLFESDANGCAVVQTDDIIRSKTIGKITSTEKQVVYDDGSFLVTCVLYSG